MCPNRVEGVHYYVIEALVRTASWLQSLKGRSRPNESSGTARVNLYNAGDPSRVRLN